MKLYIAVLDEVPDFMVPTLVAHSVLGAHLHFYRSNGESLTPSYNIWLIESFRKVVLRVNRREFDKIAALPDVYLGHENSTLEGTKSCAVVCPREEYPNVLKFAKMWRPN